MKSSFTVMDKDLNPGNPDSPGRNAADRTMDRHDGIKVFREKGISIIEPSKVPDDMKVQGYTIQIIAMTKGIPPSRAYLKRFSNEVIKMSSGQDGLDRYYIRKYDSLGTAAIEMQKLREQGFDDVFVRAIAEYDRL